MKKQQEEISFTWRGLLIGWWVTNRMEYAPSAINEVGIPALLALFHRPLDSDFGLAVLGGLAVWWIAEFVGSSLNCLADYETDRLDIFNKARITRAIDGIGLRRLYILNFIEIVINTLLVLLLAYWKGRPLLLIFWLIGLAFSFAYSFEPLKFKRRGLLNIFTLDIILYVSPMFFVYHLLSPIFHADAVIIILLFCLQMIPMFFVDEVSDYDEDRSTNMTNPCVLYGRYRVSIIAFVIYTLSSISMLAMVLYFWPATTLIHVVMYFLASLCFFKVFLDFWSLIKISKKIELASTKKTYQDLLPIIKKQVRTPLWLMLTGIGIWLVLIANLTPLIIG